MNILFVTNVVPDPEGGGAPRRAAMHLRALRQLGEVTLVLPPTDGIPLQDQPGLSVLERGHALTDARKWRHEGSHSLLKQLYHGLRRLHPVDGRAYKEEAKEFRATLTDRFDLVFAFRLRSALWYESVFKHHSKAVRVVDFDDIESRVFEKQIESIDGPWWWRAKLLHELRWLRRTERRIARWDGVILCSRLDADRFKDMTGVEPWIVPNAYQFDKIETERSSPPCRLLFVGTFVYFPNAQGIQWFVEEIWPRVRAILDAEVELTLVGLHPPPDILALGERSGIMVKGNVPSVAPYYKITNIVIAPLKAGSGTRIKLIEAAAKGRAIVTTSIGCEGLDFVDGVHAEIADDPAEFAKRIVALSSDGTRRARLAEAARAHAIQAFSADAVTANLHRSLRTLVANRNRK